jgi:hypothetical protein
VELHEKNGWPKGADDFFHMGGGRLKRSRRVALRMHTNGVSRIIKDSEADSRHPLQSFYRFKSTPLQGEGGIFLGGPRTLVSN